MNKEPHTVDSGGSRGLNVIFSGEDLLVVSHILDECDPTTLGVPDKTEVRFVDYELPCSDIPGLHGDFSDYRACIDFTLQNGRFDSLLIQLSYPEELIDDPKDLQAKNTFVIMAQPNSETPYIIMDMHKSLTITDPTIVQNAILMVLLNIKDTHPGEYSYKAVLDYLKLLYPKRKELYTYKTTTELFAEHQYPPDTYDFTNMKAAAGVSIAHTYNDFDQHDCREVTIVASHTAPVSCSESDSSVAILTEVTGTRVFTATVERDGTIQVDSAISSATTKGNGPQDHAVENRVAEGGAMIDDYLRALEGSLLLIKNSR